MLSAMYQAGMIANMLAAWISVSRRPTSSAELM